MQHGPSQRGVQGERGAQGEQVAQEEQGEEKSVAELECGAGGCQCSQHPEVWRLLQRTNRQVPPTQTVDE